MPGFTASLKTARTKKRSSSVSSSLSRPLCRTKEKRQMENGKCFRIRIKSMPGFGQGSAEGDDFRVRVDIRSVNNRALDVHTRLPQELSSLEVTLKKQVQAAVKRGRVDLTVMVEQLRPAIFEINRPLVSG